MSTRFALRAAALSAAALLALTACGGDDDDPLGSPESSPAAGGIGGAPTIPDAATKNTDAGAEAFTRYYFEAILNNAYATGNYATLIKYSDPKCIICRATVGDIATAWARGKSEGGQVTLSSLDVNKADNLTNVEVKLSKTRYVELQDGKNVFSTPAQNNLNFLVQLQWDADEKTWHVREIVPPALRGAGSGASPSPTP